jgi:hypothetical protein
VIAGYWPNSQANANIVPVVANGKVYVASYGQVDIFGLNASGTITPLYKHEAAPPTSATQGPTLHVLYGTIKASQGTLVTVETRAGKTVTIDAAEAIANHRITPAAETIVVLGRYDSAGVLHAVSIGRAKNDIASWRPDR